MIDDYFTRYEINISDIFDRFARNLPEALFYGYQRWTGLITLPARENSEFSLFGPITDVVSFINLTQTKMCIDPTTGFIPDINNIRSIYDNDNSPNKTDTGYYTMLGKYLCMLNPISSESISIQVSKMTKNSNSTNLELMDHFKRLYYAMHSRDINSIYHSIEKLSLAKKNMLAENVNTEIPIVHNSTNARINTRFK